MIRFEFDAGTGTNCDTNIFEFGGSFAAFIFLNISTTATTNFCFNPGT